VYTYAWSVCPFLFLFFISVMDFTYFSFLTSVKYLENIQKMMVSGGSWKTWRKLCLNFFKKLIKDSVCSLRNFCVVFPSCLFLIFTHISPVTHCHAHQYYLKHSDKQSNPSNPSGSFLNENRELLYTPFLINISTHVIPTIIRDWKIIPCVILIIVCPTTSDFFLEDLKNTIGSVIVVGVNQEFIESSV